MPRLIASAGEAIAAFDPFDPDLTLVGAVQAVEHAHQGALACTVLPEEGVDLAA